VCTRACTSAKAGREVEEEADWFGPGQPKGNEGGNISSPGGRVNLGTTYNKPMFAMVFALFGYNRRYNGGATRERWLMVGTFLLPRWTKAITPGESCGCSRMVADNGGWRGKASAFVGLWRDSKGK
jgi:hypothetical protein